MAQKFMKTQEVADYLGLPPADVNNLRETHQLHAYRDGADWKFKAEDVEQFARSRQASGSEPPAEDHDEADVLLSEIELGESDPSTSGTVIGPPDKAIGPSESDIQLAGSDLKLAGSDLGLGGSDLVLAGSDINVAGKDSGVDDIDLTLDADVVLEDSQLVQKAPGSGSGSGSGKGKKDQTVTDDDIVLGGSGSGSDITIGGDSGISLVDPADSGLSLEDPLDISGSEESLELGEDDMLSLSDEAGDEASAELKADDDFLLTPLEEASDDDSESGSQVIALDGDVASDQGATMIARTSGVGMSAMLDEDFPAAAGMPMGSGISGTMSGMSGIGGSGVALGPAVAPIGPAPTIDPALAAQMAIPEAPYTVWDMVLLSLCLLVLIFGGMMSYDLLRNMWSWNAPYAVNSSLMDWILGLLG